MQRFVKVDGKVRTDATYPAGFMDVIEIEKTNENFRLVYDAKGRFVPHRISKEEAAYKLCKVKRQQFGKGNVPYIATHDGRTIRYPDPDIKVQHLCCYIECQSSQCCNEWAGRQCHCQQYPIIRRALLDYTRAKASRLMVLADTAGQ